MMENLDAYIHGTIPAWKQRVLITKWVGEAWSLTTRQRALVQQFFVNCGIVWPVNGSMANLMHHEQLEDYTFPDLEL